MALEDNRVITNPDLIAANNPNYGVGQVKPKVPNLFAGLTNQQQRNMTYSADELDRGYKSVVPVQQVQPTVDPLSGHESVGHGSEVAMPRLEERMTATPKVQTVAQTPQYSQPRPQITSMDELAAAMGYTSPEEEARLRKASVNNQRILAVADALRHIGNIANTANYAPSQQFNRPWAEEQARYEQGKALRDKANNALFSYQRQRAEQERAERKLDAQIKKQEADAERAERWNQARIDRINAQNAKTDDERYLLQTRARLMEQGWPLDKANKEAQIALRKEQTRLAQVKADQGGFAPKKGSSGGRRSGGRARAGQGGGKYWIDVPGEGRVYYPNQTMWKQGIEQYSDGSDRYEEVQTGTDALGRPQKKQVKTSYEQRSKNIREGKTYVRKSGRSYSNTAKLFGKFKKN